MECVMGIGPRGSMRAVGADGVGHIVRVVAAGAGARIAGAGAAGRMVWVGAAGVRSCAFGVSSHFIGGSAVRCAKADAGARALAANIKTTSFFMMQSPVQDRCRTPRRRVGDGTF